MILDTYFVSVRRCVVALVLKQSPRHENTPITPWCVKEEELSVRRIKE
jgi:hypothetical protein